MLNVQALTFNPVLSTTNYLGGMPLAPSATEGLSRFYIPFKCKIQRVFLEFYSTVAGDSDAWSAYIRVNATTDYLIETVSNSADHRLFTNLAMDIELDGNDYFQIKIVNPAWTIPPTGVTINGFVEIVDIY